MGGSPQSTHPPLASLALSLPCHRSHSGGHRLCPARNPRSRRLARGDRSGLPLLVDGNRRSRSASLPLRLQLRPPLRPLPRVPRRSSLLKRRATRSPPHPSRKVCPQQRQSLRRNESPPH